MQYHAEKIKTYIINWLLDGGLGFNSETDSIGLEVKFSPKRRLADMMIISKNLHALEIKSENDNLTKIQDQIYDYRRTFEKVSVISTKKHLKGIRKLVSPQVGIILFENKSLKIIRKPKNRKRLDKQSLLMFLNKQDLYKNIKISDNFNYSTDELRLIAEKKLTLKKIEAMAKNKLRIKYSRLMELLKHDMGKEILIDDLQTLYGQVKEIS